MRNASRPTWGSKEVQGLPGKFSEARQEKAGIWLDRVSLT